MEHMEHMELILEVRYKKVDAIIFFFFFLEIK